MPVDTTSRAGRRAIADEYKERKVSRGIFAVRCAASGQTWVESSPNLDAARNSLWFQLNAGRYRNSALQQAWIQHGAGAFVLDVQEKFSDDVAELLLNDLYASKKKEWVAALQADSL